MELEKKNETIAAARTFFNDLLQEKVTKEETDAQWSLFRDALKKGISDK